MNLKECRIGLALSGSFCTIPNVLEELHSIKQSVSCVTPIVSYNVAKTDTRFGKCEKTLSTLCEKCGAEVIKDIASAEPIGPKKIIDVLVIAPCTGNTLSKIALGITDTPVTLAAKAHLRNKKPIVIALASNDALGLSAKNVGVLMNAKNVYFVPMRQDSPFDKENSLVADMTLILPTVEKALEKEQLQPLFMREG